MKGTRWVLSGLTKNCLSLHIFQCYLILSDYGDCERGISFTTQKASLASCEAIPNSLNSTSSINKNANDSFLEFGRYSFSQYSGRCKDFLSPLICGQNTNHKGSIRSDTKRRIAMSINPFIERLLHLGVKHRAVGRNLCINDLSRLPHLHELHHHQHSGYQSK